MLTDLDGKSPAWMDEVFGPVAPVRSFATLDEANAPFGGVGWSGNGSRIGGLETNLDAFTDTQWLTVRSSIAPYPF